MRILFVAGLFSHAARWIHQLVGTDWDIHVVGWHEPIHPLLQKQANVTIHSLPRTRWPFTRGKYRLKRLPVVRRFLFPDMPRYLTRLIRALRPACIHSMGWSPTLNVLLAKDLLGGTLPGKWIYSCLGSDIYPHVSDLERVQMIRRVLMAIDFYIAGCQRDIDLACRLGFRGEVLGKFPGPGAYPIAQMLTFRQPGPASERRIIAVKGYQHATAGRAITALAGIRLAADSVRGFKIVVHSAIGTWASKHFADVKAYADEVSAREKIDIQFIPFSPVEEFWTLLGRSRVSIGVSASDGVPNAMLESMVMGAFPIQSDVGGASAEWIDHGVNGLLVPHDDPRAIAEAIRVALSDDHLVDRAAEINLQITRERLDATVLVPRIRAIYEKIGAGMG